MKIIEKEVSKVLRDENRSFSNYLSFLQGEGKQLMNDNLVLDLSEVEDLGPENLKSLLPWAEAQRDRKKSFVVVTTAVDISEVPEELNVVPTLGEAEDLIQMEEIERDLGF